MLFSRTCFGCVPNNTKRYIEQSNVVDGASMDNPNISMIPFPTCIILDREIIPTYIMGNHLNKAIKDDSSIPMDFSPNRIIKQDILLHSQTPMLWGCHPMMKLCLLTL